MSTLLIVYHSNCYGFTGSLIIPDSVTYLGTSVFYGCDGFNGNLIISKNVTSIGTSAFEDCRNLTGVLTIPDRVMTIGDYAFRNCRGFSGLELSQSLEYVGPGAFTRCYGFKGSLIIPENVTEICGSAFYDCSGFTGCLVIPGKVSSIGGYAFYCCSGFSELIFLDGIKSIGSHAFSGCSGVDSVYFYGDVPSIGRSAISNDLTLYYLEGNTSGWTTPTWTSSGGTVYNTATFVPGEENIKGEVSTTWNISPENIPAGDIYSFSGAVSTTAPSGLKDIQININSATEDGVGIKWYRGTSLGTASFDLSSVPEIKMGESYTGDNGQTITLSSGSEWNIQIFATDNRGNALGDKIIKKITVVRVDNAPPVVEMLPVVELSSSTVKLQAKVVNDRDRIISNFGFNLYDAENDEMFYAQYSAWHEDPYYRNVSYDPETRIISVELEDYPANRTAYVQAFAIYYDGETEIIGFSAGRDKFTTYPADIIINTPVDSTILPDGGPITVEGVIEEKVSGFEYSDTVIRLYDYRMEEIASVNAVIDADLKFKADCDIPGNYAGLYHLVVEVKCGETQIKSSTVKLYIPGKLEVQILPLDDAEVYSTRAFISAKVSDDQGKKIENYGFNIYDSDGNFVCQYSLWHAEEKYCGVNYDNKSGVLSGTVSLEAGKTYYYEPFVVYYENGIPVNCFSSDKGILMTKTADIRIDTPASLRYVGSSKTITVKGSVDDYGAVSVDTPKLFVYVGDTLIDTLDTRFEGGKFTVTADFSKYAYGTYKMQAYLEVDGRSTFSKKITIEYMAPVNNVGLSVFSCNGFYKFTSLSLEFEKYHSPVLVTDLGKDVHRVKEIHWTTEDEELVLTPWYEEKNEFYLARPSKCQIDCRVPGNYEITVKFVNYDGSVFTKQLAVVVKEFVPILVIDYLTAEPVKDATVIVDGITEKTDEKGYAIFNAAFTGEVDVQITKAGYNVYQSRCTLNGNDINTFRLFDVSEDVFGAYMSTNGQGKIDVLNIEYYVDVDSNNLYNLEIVTNNQKDIEEVYIVQSKDFSKKLASSKDGVIKNIPAGVFEPDCSVYAYVRYSGGRVSGKKLLQICPIKNVFNVEDELSISFGKETSFMIPKDVPVIGGGTIGIDLSFVPITVVGTENGVYKITVGLRPLVNSEKYKENVDAYNSISDAVDALDKGDTSLFKKIYQEKLKKSTTSLIKDKLSGIKGSLLSNANGDFDIIGYIEFNSKTGTADGKVVLIFEFETKTEQQYFAGPVPIVVGINFKTAVKPSIGLHITGINKLADFSRMTCETTAVVDIPISLRLSAGVGVAYLANVSVYGKGSIDTELDLKYREARVTGSIEGGISASALCFSYEKVIAKKTWELFSNMGENKQYFNSSPGMIAFADLYDQVNFSVADRSYLTNTSEWYTKENSEELGDREKQYYLSGSPEIQYTTMMSNVYSDTQMQVIKTDFGALMVWLSDDTNRTAINRANLVYSVYDNKTGKWSVPQSVENNGTVDSYPHLYSNNGDIILAWVDLAEIMPDDATLDECFKNAEIKVAKFNSKTMSFVDTVNITENSVSDIAPKIYSDSNGIARIIWSSFEGDNIIALSGVNKLYTSKIDGSDLQLVTTSEKPIVSYTGGEINDDTIISFIIDNDSDISSNSDRDLFVVSLASSEKTKLDSGSVSEIEIANEMLIWTNGNSVSVSKSFDKAKSFSHYLSSFDVYADENYVYIYTIDQDTKQLLVYKYDLVTEECSDAMILQYDTSMNYVDICNIGERMLLVFTKTESGSSSICYSIIADSADLRLNYAYYDDSDLNPGHILPIELNVSNLGMTDVESISIDFSNANGYSFTQMFDVNIPAGSTVDTEVWVQLPQLLDNTVSNYTIKVTAVEYNDKNILDNEKTVTIGYADLAVDAKMNYVADDGAIVSALVSNNSHFGGDAVLNVRKGTLDGEILYSETISGLDKDEILTYSFAITPEILKSDDNYVGIFVEVVGKAEEIITSNNTEQLVYEIVRSVDMNISGEITSYISDGETVTIRLLDISGNEVASAQTISGGYSLSAPAGEYALEVSKNDHVTRSYPVTLGTDNITLDVKIHPKGDINGDGKVNTTDVGRANAHAKKTSLLTDYALACADVSGDGKINTTDVGRMNAHAKKTNLLW